jgi:alpha/beta superfamily hydrolase
MHFDTKIGRNYARLHIENITILCHGLPFERGSVVEKGYNDLALFFALNGINSLIFDFSGTGFSDGEFSIKNWVEDLKNICSEFNSVNLVGFSMGGVVAANVAAEVENVESLVIASSPCCADTIRNAKNIYENAKSKEILRGLSDFESFEKMLRHEMKEFEPIRRISEVRCPILIVHGTSDDVVPFENGIMLFEKASEPKTFLEVRNGSHFLRQERVVVEKIIEWMKKEKKGVSQEVISL